MQWHKYREKHDNKLLFKCIFMNVQIRVQRRKKKIKRPLIDQFIQEWNGKLEGSNKGKQYKLLKDNIEKYLITLPIQYVSPLFKLRTLNHKFPVETGRWSNTPYHERFCRNDISDNFHYLLVCKYLENR